MGPAFNPNRGRLVGGSEEPRKKKGGGIHVPQKSARHNGVGSPTGMPCQKKGNWGFTSKKKANNARGGCPLEFREGKNRVTKSAGAKSGAGRRKGGSPGGSGGKSGLLKGKLGVPNASSGEKPGKMRKKSLKPFGASSKWRLGVGEKGQLPEGRLCGRAQGGRFLSAEHPEIKEKKMRQNVKA